MKGNHIENLEPRRLLSAGAGPISEGSAVISAMAARAASAAAKATPRIQGALNAADGRSATCYADFFAITAAKKGKAAIKMLSKGVDSFLIVMDAKGTREIVRDNDSAGGQNALVKFNVKKGVRYTIVASTAYPNDAGKYTLTLSNHLHTARKLKAREIYRPVMLDDQVLPPPPPPEDDNGGGGGVGGGGGGTTVTSLIPNQLAGYTVRVVSGGTYANDPLTGLTYQILNLTGRSGALIVSPTYPSSGSNGRNARDFGFYISDNIGNPVPGLGPGGDMHFSTNTSLNRDLGIRHASTLFSGAVDQTPANVDVVSMQLNETSGRVTMNLDQNALGSTGQTNWFIKSNSGLTAVGPVSIIGGSLSLQFHANGSVSGSATFYAIDNAGWSFGTAMYQVQFVGTRAG